MVDDITRFTFLADSLTYQAGLDELSISLPAGLSSVEMLIKSLGESTGCSVGQDITWWNTLFHVLICRSDWNISPQRITFLHADLPPFADPSYRWQEQHTYLRVLLDSMDWIQKANEKQKNRDKQYELTVIFPIAVYEAVQAALFHPPVWQATIGFSDDLDITGEWSASWSTVLRYLHALDGLLAQTCMLEREDAGAMAVFYRRTDATYHLEHRFSTAQRQEETFALIENDPTTWTGLSFAQMHEIVKTFFMTGQLSSLVHWRRFDDEMWGRQDSFRGEENCHVACEERLPDHSGLIRETIHEGMREAVNEVGERAWQMEYWKELLTRQHVSLSRCLAALCIIGLSDLPESTALLRPFLSSAEKRERWVSAILLGRQKESKALPILLSMLTDELPLERPQGVAYDAWYDCWRLYAPRLLREWQLPEEKALLREALHLWMRSEPLFDQEFDAWECCEEALRYELIFLGDRAVLDEMEPGYRRKRLQRKIRQGNMPRDQLTSSQPRVIPHNAWQH